MAVLKELVIEKRLFFVKTGMNVFDVAKYMDLHNIGAVPVLDNENKLKGIFSERDLVRRCISKELDLKTTKIDDVMTSQVYVIDISDTPEYCMQIMKQQKIRHMPVIEEHKLIGLVSMRDLLLYDMKLKEEKIEMLNTYIQYNG
ncbi:MAG: CBS domain-containing protein [Ignavibacteriae bacterium]|nr:CBS domain-containing protein [Ignavibacteriota bacterium]